MQRGEERVRKRKLFSLTAGKDERETETEREKQRQRETGRQTENPIKLQEK